MSFLYFLWYLLPFINIFSYSSFVSFTRYFSQTAPILLNDISLYCVSAWNDLSRRDSLGDPAVVMRSQTMAGLGWMLSREIYKEVIQKWPAWDKVNDGFSLL